MGLRSAWPTCRPRRWSGRRRTGRRRLAAGPDAVLTVPTDVSQLEQVQALRDAAYARFGEVAVLMNNAGTAPGGGPWDHIDRWRRVLEVNLWGVINGVQTFTPAMLAQQTRLRHHQHRIQAGHHLPARRHRLQRQQGRREGDDRGAGAQPAQRGRRAHLRASAGAGLDLHRHDAPRPDREAAGAWTPDQVVDMLIEGMGQGDFYIICPDNEVTREIDNRRILWAAQDITENRPALSRWHPDYKEAFERFLKG